MFSYKKVAISLVTWNGEKYLEALMSSIFTQTFKDFEILVIDNGSSDGTVAFFEKNYPQIKLIKNQKNLGFAKGHNLGIDQSPSDYVLILNQDVILEPDFLAQLVEFMDKNKKTGLAGGKLLKLKDKGKTKIIDSVGQKIFRTHQVVEMGTGEEDHGQYDKSSQVFGVSATIPLYRRLALEDVKIDKEYFDEDFFSYKEDIDLNYRLRLYGWEIWYLPRAIAYHDRSAQGVKAGFNFSMISYRRKKSEFIKFHSYKNHWFILIKNLTWYNFFWLFPYIFIYELTKFFYLLFFETKTFKDVPIIFQKLPAMVKKRKIIMKNKKISNKELFRWFE
ncbi:MAG: glycosyltransferase family 2 protein [bacterium]